MVSAFTLIFAASASAQNSMRRYDQRFIGQQQRRDLYEQHRRRELMPAEGRDNAMLGPSLGGAHRIGVTRMALFSCAGSRGSRHIVVALDDHDEYPSR